MITKWGYTYLEDHERKMGEEEFEGLTIRCKNCLLAEGLFTKQQVKDLFHIDYTMSELRKIPNLGRKLHREIGIWLGAYDNEYKNKLKILDLSMRDKFACKAMEALISSGKYIYGDIAHMSYEMADKMMEAKKNVS